MPNKPQDPSEIHKGSDGTNINSLIQALPNGTWTEWEQQIFDVAKPQLKAQIKPCRRKIGVYDYACETKNKVDCEADGKCQWFVINDIVLIKDLVLPTPQNLDFESDKHFMLTRMAAHENIWTLGLEAKSIDQAFFENYRDRNYWSHPYLNPMILPVYQKYESRMSRRSQLKDFCNKANINKVELCGDAKSDTACKESFQVLGDCASRPDCRLCLVSSGESKCEWVKIGTNDATCREKRDDDTPYFQAKTLKECLEYDKSVYGTSCFRYKDCATCHNNAWCKWVWYETDGGSSNSPSPVCMFKSKELVDIHGAVTKKTRLKNGSAGGSSCADFTRYDEDALKRSQLDAIPCKWTADESAENGGICEKDDANKDKCRRGGGIATRFQSLMFPQSDVLTTHANRREENTCTWTFVDDKKKEAKGDKGYDTSGKGVPDLHIDTNLAGPELMYYLVEHQPIKKVMDDTQYYGLDVMNAWGPIDDKIFVAPLSVRDDGNDPTHPEHGHKCVKTDDAIKLNYVQAKSGEMWMWKTTHVMHGALYVFDDEILQHTKDSHCRSSVEFRFLPVSTTKPEVLCMHYSTVYDPTTCNADDSKPCRLVTDNSCHGKFGPGPKRIDDCATRTNCFVCTMSGKVTVSDETKPKCEWVKLHGDRPKCRARTNDADVTKASEVAQCTGIIDKDPIAPSPTPARFRSIAESTTIDEEIDVSEIVAAIREVCSELFVESADMGGEPVFIPDECADPEAYVRKTRGRKQPKAMRETGNDSLEPPPGL